jgi:hypothetical protein
MCKGRYCTVPRRSCRGTNRISQSRRLGKSLLHAPLPLQPSLYPLGDKTVYMWYPKHWDVKGEAYAKLTCSKWPLGLPDIFPALASRHTACGICRLSCIWILWLQLLGAVTIKITGVVLELCACSSCGLKAACFIQQKLLPSTLPSHRTSSFTTNIGNRDSTL